MGRRGGARVGEGGESEGTGDCVKDSAVIKRQGQSCANVSWRASLSVSESLRLCVCVCAHAQERDTVPRRVTAAVRAQRASSSLPLLRSAAPTPHMLGRGRGGIFFKHPRLMASRLPFISPLCLPVSWAFSPIQFPVRAGARAVTAPPPAADVLRPGYISSPFFWSHRSVTSCARTRTRGKRGRGSRRRGAAARARCPRKCHLTPPGPTPGGQPGGRAALL